MRFAIVESGGKQYRAIEGRTIEVDRLRVKPIVKITGEFWAQTTEGDGNFHMFEFLEREGAYNVPQTPRERLRRAMAQPTADAWNRSS